AALKLSMDLDHELFWTFGPDTKHIKVEQCVEIRFEQQSRRGFLRLPEAVRDDMGRFERLFHIPSRDRAVTLVGFQQIRSESRLPPTTSTPQAFLRFLYLLFQRLNQQLGVGQFRWSLVGHR